MLQASDKWILSFWHVADNAFILCTLNRAPFDKQAKSLSWYTDNATRDINKNLNTLTEIQRYEQTVPHKWTANSIYFMVSSL